jgi:nucleoside-diphosphate-sugar epimerase
MIPLQFTNYVNKSITILGCGWLGLPLAVKLVASGWAVKGSTTSPEKLQKLQESKIDPYLVQLADLPAADKRFFESEVLLINIPPGLRTQSAEAYLAQMDQLLLAVKQSPVKQVIFISSTSVYPELNRQITDVQDVDGSSALYQSELLFTQCSAFITTVIRFAGLVGLGRHPARFFAGKQNIPNGQSPVNLIHLDDCIGIIQSLLSQQKFGGTYHVAAPAHPGKAAFYAAAAKHTGLPLPEFVDELKEWKIIDDITLVNRLGYKFIYPDLVEWVNPPQP